MFKPTDTCFIYLHCKISPHCAFINLLSDDADVIKVRKGQIKISLSSIYVSNNPDRTKEELANLVQYT